MTHIKEKMRQTGKIAAFFLCGQQNAAAAAEEKQQERKNESRKWKASKPKPNKSAKNFAHK